MKTTGKFSGSILFLMGFFLAGIVLTYLGVHSVNGIAAEPVEENEPERTHQSANRVVLVTQKEKESPAGKFLNMVYTEAFGRLGITFQYEQFPASRASLLSDTGTVDGELSRIYSYNEVHPNLIRVETPHWHSGFVAVARDSFIHLDGWDSLKGTNLRVNYRRGIKGCDVNLPKVVESERLEVVDSINDGFEKLLAGRADVFIGSEMDVISVLESNEFKDSGLNIHGIMEHFTAHAFIHKQREELVPKLAEVLQAMKQEGLLREYRDAAELKRYIDDN